MLHSILICNPHISNCGDEIIATITISFALLVCVLNKRSRISLWADFVSEFHLTSTWYAERKRLGIAGSRQATNFIAMDEKVEKQKHF